MIGCKAPENARELRNFWRLAVHNKVTRVICLASSMEGHKSKLYIPTSTKDEFEAGDYTIKLVQEVDSSFCIKRDLQVLLEDKIVHSVTHLHFIAWQDLDVPNEDGFRSLMSLVKYAGRFVAEQIISDESERLLVHCGKGRGRTGTFFTLLNVHIELQKQLDNGMSIEQLKVSPFAILKKLRQQRNWLVETLEQYELIYSSIVGDKNLSLALNQE